MEAWFNIGVNELLLYLQWFSHNSRVYSASSLERQSTPYQKTHYTGTEPTSPCLIPIPVYAERQASLFGYDEAGDRTPSYHLFGYDEAGDRTPSYLSLRKDALTTVVDRVGVSRWMVVVQGRIILEVEIVLFSQPYCSYASNTTHVLIVLLWVYLE